MKKFITLALVVLGIFAFLLFRKPKIQDTPVARDPRPEPAPSAEPNPEPVQSASTPAVTPTETATAETVERDWMALTLQHQLTPDTLEAWAKKEGIPITRETKGHPASGERLEMIWGADPVTTASFDILGEGRFQLSAVRSIYPVGTSMSDLKAMLQYIIKQPIEREDNKSAVFKADEQGLLVWFARQDDGRVKVAFEYGAHAPDEP